MGLRLVKFGLLGFVCGCGPAVTLEDDAGGSGESGGSSSGAGPVTTMTTVGSATGTGTGGVSSDGDPDTTAAQDDSTGPGATGTTEDDGTSTDTGEPIVCDPPDAVAALPNIWVANASQGTISRVDTATVVETGRFLVREDGAGSPSRTAVAFNGDVAVANRMGGVAKVYANVDDCVESNGTPGIQTSTDSTVLAWGEEECVAWFTPLDYTSNRPLAWTPGVLNEETCAFEGSNVWTAGSTGVGTAEVLLLDGETGTVLESVPIPEVLSGIGLYGGAVDGEGNFWGIETGAALYRVDADDYSVERWAFADAAGTVPGYGITVDAEGRPLTCGGGSAARFDYGTQTWEFMVGGSSGIGGCATDGQGVLWHSASTTLYAIDVDTMTVQDSYPIPEYFHGVSVDFNGQVWGVPIGGSSVHRVDPSNGNVDTLPGFFGLYTYSDMTGLALAAVSGFASP